MQSRASRRVVPLALPSLRVIFHPLNQGICNGNKPRVIRLPNLMAQGWKSPSGIFQHYHNLLLQSKNFFKCQDSSWTLALPKQNYYKMCPFYHCIIDLNNPPSFTL